MNRITTRSGGLTSCREGEPERVDHLVDPLTDGFLFDREGDHVDENALAFDVQYPDPVDQPRNVVVPCFLDGPGPCDRRLTAARRDIEIGRERPFQVEPLVAADAGTATYSSLLAITSTDGAASGASARSQILHCLLALSHCTFWSVSGDPGPEPLGPLIAAIAGSHFRVGFLPWPRN